VVAVLVWALVAAPVSIVETAPVRLNSSDVPDAIDVFPELFAGAESSIDIAQMYMLHYAPESRGRLLYRLYDALVEAAGRGVRVRVLLDGLTLLENTDQTYQRMADRLAVVPGIEVRGCDLRRFSDYPGCLMHAKYIVVDGCRSVVGSHNWSWGAFAENRELSLVVDDTAFGRALGAVFLQDWIAAVGETLTVSARSDGPVRLAVSGPAGLKTESLGLESALAGLIAGAQRSLDLAVNSLTTRDDLGRGRFGLVDSLFRTAAARGVRVRVMVDRWAWEHEPELMLSLDSVAGVTVRVADIRAAGEDEGIGTMHAKVVIADGTRFLLGTATMGQRQLLECRNVAVRAEDPGVGAQLVSLFERDWESGWCRPVAR